MNRIIPISDLATAVAIGGTAASNADGSRQAATATADAVEAVVLHHHPHAAKVADSGGVPAAEAEAMSSPATPVDREAEEYSSVKGQTNENDVHEDGGAGVGAGAGVGPVSGPEAATLAKPRAHKSGTFTRRKDWGQRNRVTPEILKALNQELEIFSGSGEKFRE